MSGSCACRFIFVAGMRIADSSREDEFSTHGQDSCCCESSPQKLAGGSWLICSSFASSMHTEPSEDRSSSVASSVFFAKENNSDEVTGPPSENRGARKMRSFLQNISRPPFSTHSQRHKHSRSEHSTAPLENITTPQQIRLFRHRKLMATPLRQLFGVRSMNCRFVCAMLPKRNHIADFASRDVNAADQCASTQTQGMQRGVATHVRHECG